MLGQRFVEAWKKQQDDERIEELHNYLQKQTMEGLAEYSTKALYYFDLQKRADEKEKEYRRERRKSMIKGIGLALVLILAFLVNAFILYLIGPTH